jgi:hypothetical protein
VAELAALRRARLAAVTGTELVAWHEALARAVDRISRWRRLPDSEPVGLGEWVAWLRTTYRLADRLPERWPDDPAITAELAALHRAWQAATAASAPGADQLHWHDALARVLDRLQHWQEEARRQLL